MQNFKGPYFSCKKTDFSDFSFLKSYKKKHIQFLVFWVTFANCKTFLDGELMATSDIDIYSRKLLALVQRFVDPNKY